MQMPLRNLTVSVLTCRVGMRIAVRNIVYLSTDNWLDAQNLARAAVARFEKGDTERCYIETVREGFVRFADSLISRVILLDDKGAVVASGEAVPMLTFMVSEGWDVPALPSEFQVAA